MASLIRKLRDKPEKERRRIVLFTTVFVTLVIVIFWAISLPQKLSIEEEENSQVSSPTNAFFGIVGSALNSLRESF